MSNAAIVAAGGAFAGAALLGLAAGIFIAYRSGQQLWVAAGLGGGLLLGSYTAFRLLTRSSK